MMTKLPWVGLFLFFGCAHAVPARRAILISIDGLRADALQVLGQQGAPTFHRLMAEGASTLNARTDPTRTYTLPNHTCILTGRYTDGAQGHHFTRNSLEGPGVHAVAGRYLPSLFDPVHDAGGRTLFFSSKPKFAIFTTAWDFQNGAPDITGADDGRAKIDQAIISTDAVITLAAAQALATEPPELLFLHLRAPDSAGHNDGFSVTEGSAYLQAVRDTDARLQKLLVPVFEESPPHTLVVLTSDHGGEGYGHRESANPLNFTIPFIVRGPGYPANSDLYQVLGQTPPTAQTPLDQGDPIRNCQASKLILTGLNLQ